MDKPWKIPWGARVGKTAIKKGYATICIINENGGTRFIKAKVEDGTISIDGFPRLATADYCLSHNGKPFYIIPTWSMKPFSPVEHYAETEREKMNMAGRRVILAKLEREAIKPTGKGFGMIGWIILGAIVLGVGYYLITGGKLFG